MKHGQAADAGVEDGDGAVSVRGIHCARCSHGRWRFPARCDHPFMRSLVTVGVYGFSGEGMTWERVITLERTGSKLRRTEKGGEEGPVDLTYTACPA